MQPLTQVMQISHTGQIKRINMPLPQTKKEVKIIQIPSAESMITHPQESIKRLTAKQPAMSGREGNHSVLKPKTDAAACATSGGISKKLEDLTMGSLKDGLKVCST